ncbi:helix-turn-helix domain-containing protein [Natrononativus amylolyticus]|uniref:helix-turn-helix domain-containing protein n=1 Tax=Natrononativus amylolyticus TaxID=2963434 RepID=UPI0020CBA594|nr:helix-turn-helix domain-containing protein [Natrononativus amylolyticus]
MGLIAEFRLQSPDAPLVDVARAVPGCTITVEYEEQTVSGPIVHVVRVECASFGAFEAALEAAEYVEEVTLISDGGAARTYHVINRGPFPKEMDELTLNKTLIERMRVTEDGWHLRQRFANRDELAAYREGCRRMGSRFYLDRLYETADADRTVPGISDKQREALLAAYEAGYFAVPRRSSLEDVAADLDISRSALAERLHRGEAHLLEHYVHDDQY